MAVHSRRFIEFISRMEDRVLAESILDWLNRDISTGTVRFYEKPVMGLMDFSEAFLKGS